MRVYTALLVLVIAVIIAVPAMAQTVLIPRYTVIPVAAQDSLSSATAKVGDLFYAACATEQCAGFPANTRFLGVVTSVTAKSGKTPGQIGVVFQQAELPDGQRLNINGTLTSLSSTAVKTDPQTGNLMGTVESRDQRNKFIGYGAGAGLLIGALTGSTLKGGLIGAAAGWILGATIGTEREAKEAVVPAGTQFGIMLQNPVNFTTGASGGAGPDEFNVRLTGLQPYTTVTGVLMVPFRAAMNELNAPFTYSAATRSVVMTTSQGTLTHVMGTRYLTLNGDRMLLPASSRVINGSLYVPADVFAIATGMNNVTWNASTDTLTIK